MTLASDNLRKPLMYLSIPETKTLTVPSEDNALTRGAFRRHPLNQTLLQLEMFLFLFIKADLDVE